MHDRYGRANDSKIPVFGAATPVVLMVSGGSDSTALTYLMHDLHQRNLVGQPAILHVNHKLRGLDADKDQAFVQQLAEKLDIPFFACEIDVAALAQETGGNIEAIGRSERYVAAQQALESLCRHEMVPISEGRIVTAHTQDDRVENFYMRSIVGTGPGGFRSMLYRNGSIVRPCLDVSRDQLREYLGLLPEESVVLDDEGTVGVKMQPMPTRIDSVPMCVTRLFLRQKLVMLICWILYVEQ